MTELKLQKSYKKLPFCWPAHLMASNFVDIFAAYSFIIISNGLLGLTFIIWTDLRSAHWILSSINPSLFTSSIASVSKGAAWRRLTWGQDESY